MIRINSIKNLIDEHTKQSVDELEQLFCQSEEEIIQVIDLQILESLMRTYSYDDIYINRLNE